MDQQRYNRLTAHCNLILHQFASDYRVVAVPWLHVLNGHPNTLQYYRHAFSKRNFLAQAGLVCYNLAYMGYKLIRAIGNKGKSKNLSSQQADVLFISHLVNTDKQSGDIDFYYGALPQNVETQKGFKVILGLLDHTPGAKTKLQRVAIETKKTTTYLFPKTLSFTNEIRIIARSFASRQKLVRAANKEKDPEKKQILREAAWQAISPESCNALRIHAIIQLLIHQLKPANLVITWEGRSWERLAIETARNTKKNINCIAYQHTVLLSSSFSLKQSLGKAYDPDTIFTVGEITADTFRSSNDFSDTVIAAYGSHRLTQSPGVSATKHDNNGCLVTPEGIESECVLLFDFAVAMAKKIPETKFIFRMHPVLPFARFVKNQPQFVSLPDNCVVSDLPDIADDFKRSKYLLYRGSSVAMYAVLNGLRPVYFGLKDELTIDPLFFLDNWRKIVQNMHDFVNVISEDKNMSEDSWEEEWLNAQKLCIKYILPSNESLFLNSLVRNN